MTITEYEPKQFKKFEHPSVFAFVSREKEVLFIGTSNGHGVSFNVYTLPGKIAHMDGAKLRIYACESIFEAQCLKTDLTSKYRPIYNHPRGRKKGTKSRAYLDRFTPAQLNRELNDPEFSPAAKGQVSNNADLLNHLTESQEKYAHDPAFMKDFFTPDWEKLKPSTK